MTAYAELVARLQEQYAALPDGAPVRLGKKTSNLFRPRAEVADRLDVSGFSGVLSVDPQARTADVLGMTTYADLVDATLPFGLMPLVVPQLKTITLGGAVSGLGIEASSFRHGAPHESVLEMDILTGDGRVLTVTPDGEHRDLFYGFPNSYGTLGYALRLRIELMPVAPYVAVEHRRFTSVADAAAELAVVCDDATVDFVDGVWFSPAEVYLTVGRWAQTATAPPSDYTGMGIYYRSIQARSDDLLTVRDYLWRWDTDWFWCSRAFGAQNPRVRRWWPKGLLRSDVYWKLVAFERRHRWKTRLDRTRGRPEREEVIQDVEIPVDRLAGFMADFSREIPVEPVWFCPMRQRDPGRSWDLWPLDPTTLYVNVGFWSTVELAPGEPQGARNRVVEGVVRDHGGCKSLYSTSYYSREEFAELYNGARLEVLRKSYDPDGRLLDLYAKCVRGR